MERKPALLSSLLTTGILALTLLQLTQALPMMLNIIAIPSGQPLNLTCEAVGGPTLNVTWTTPTGLRMGSSISIDSVTADDAGDYRCEVTSDNGTANGSITIRVGVHVVAAPTDQYVSVNDTLLLTCNISGSEPISYQWFKDGQQLQDDERVSGSNSSRLEVKPVDGNDFGNYQCNASNDVDQALSEVAQVEVAPLIVNILASPSIGVPRGAAINLTCVAVGGPILNVTWTTPAGPRTGSVISVNSVTADDAGIYRCEVVSEAGTTSGFISIIGCPASSWTPPLLIGESFSLPCQDVYRGFNPKANVTWTCNEDTNLIFGIWNCTFGESVTISELAFSEHAISLEGLNETLAQLQSQAESMGTATLVNTKIGGSALSNMVTVTLVMENPPDLPTIKHRFYPSSYCYCPPSPSSNPISQRLCVAPDYITTPCQCLSDVCECNTNNKFTEHSTRCVVDTDGDGTPNAQDVCEGCCLHEISEGFFWPNTSHGTEVCLSCSELHPSFMPSSMATRRCSQEGRWEAVNTLDCTFQKEGISLVVIQIVQNFGGTPTAVQLEVTQTLSNAGFTPKNLTVSATNLQYTAFHTELAIVAELDVTTDTSVFAALLHNVERRSVYRQATGHQHSVARRAAAGIVNAVTGYVANTSCPCPPTYFQGTFNVRCAGLPQPSCVCSNMNCECAHPYIAVVKGTSEALECSVDTDGDGTPDIEDPCPNVYSPDGEEQCKRPEHADCPSEADTTWGVTWSATQFGQVDVQRCPGGLDETMGLARRECNSSSGGWEEPDLSECESLAFRNVRTETSDLLQSLLNDPDYMEGNGQPVSVQPADVQVIVEATSFLVNSTNTANARVPLFPKDLNTTNNFLDVLSLFANSTDLFANDNFAEEEALQIASNILSPNYTTQWNTLNEHPYSGGAPLLLHSAENIAVSVAANLASNRMTNVSQDGSMEAVFKTEHLAIQVAQLQPGPSDNGDKLTYKDVVFPRDKDAVASSLDIPNSMVPQMVIPGALLEARANANLTVPVVNVIFNSLERILPNMYSNGSSLGSLQLGSLLILGQVSSFQASSNTLQLHATPIRITFPVPNQSQRPLSALQCVYWDFTSETADSAENVQLGGWSSQGLRLTGSWQEGSSHVVCESTHLTSFAMLVDYSGLVAESSKEKELFSILTYVGCGISILCLLASIIFFISLKRELYTNVVHFVHINFCIALLCGLVFFLTIAPVGMTQSEGACTTVTVLVHYFFLAAFSWMLCEGLMMYILLVRVFGAHKKKWLIMYTLIGWGLPLPFVLNAFIASLASNWDYYIVTSSNVWYCWLPPDNGVVWAFIAPMLLSIIINCVFAFLAIRGIYKFKKEQLDRTSAQKKEQKLVMYCLKAILIILPLMGFTWLFGTLAAFNYSEVVRDIFSGLFVVCNTFQGVAIFVLHVVRHEKNWGKLKRLFTSKIGKKRQGTRSTQKSGTLSTSQGKPLSMEFAGLQSETENATNTLRSLPSDDDNDNLPLVLQREESLKVKGEWSSFVSNDECEGN